jgi:hypothetical protein
VGGIIPEWWAVSIGISIQIKLRPYALSVLQQMAVKSRNMRWALNMGYVAEFIGRRLPIINRKRLAAPAGRLPLEFNFSGISS